MFDTTALIIIAGSLVASIFNAAFSVGGAMIILAITSTVLPVQAIVPIHSTLLIGSTVSRVVLFREHIDWDIVWPFLFGSLAGVLIGARVYIELPEAIIATAISILMLVALWLPDGHERIQDNGLRLVRIRLRPLSISHRSSGGDQLGRHRDRQTNRRHPA